MMMARTARTAGTGIAALGLLLGAAGTAQADEQAFLDQIPPRNYFSMWTPDEQRLAAGYYACTMLRTGTPAEAVANTFNTDGNGWVWVKAAQQELCPDTLGGPK